MNNHKRVWIYCRAAGEERIDNETLTIKNEKLTAFAQKQGYEIAGITSECAAGLKLERQGIKEVFAAADASLMDILLVVDASRLARNLFAFNDCMDYLTKRNVEVLRLQDGVLNKTA
ncbi:MAG: recombinase family protein [Hungatella sp.]|jgi:DNA invertase Pin-like site-specific DNA recombinase|nr:recombinase family protein [Hungatella sp.]